MRGKGSEAMGGQGGNEGLVTEPGRGGWLRAETRCRLCRGRVGYDRVRA